MKNRRYDISLIRQYVNGELDARAMYKLERQAQEDPVLMDLIMGMESGDLASHDQAISDVHNLIDERTKDDRRQGILLLRTMGIAASLLFAVGIIILIFLRDEPVPKIARKTPRQKTPIERPEISAAESNAGAEVSEIASAQIRPEKQVKTLKESYKESLPKGISDTVLAVLANKTDTAAQSLQEVVIVGYGTMKKSELTGSVVSIKAKDTEALAGRVPGIRIRGTQSEQQEQRVYIVTGTVVDAKNKEPLPGASVKVKGENISATTDLNGRFSITLPELGKSLEVLYLGYEKESVKATKDGDIIVALEPDTRSLNEVVVVGYGRQTSNEEIREAHPANGWVQFRKYIKQGAKAGNKDNRGVVTISFIVSPSGEVSNVKVVKGINDLIDRKAVDLIENGPEWLGDKDGSPKEIKLRIRFQN